MTHPTTPFVFSCEQEDVKVLAADNGKLSTTLHTDRRRKAASPSPASGGGFIYNSPIHDGNLPMGCNIESIPRAVGANCPCVITTLNAVGEPQGRFHYLSPGGPASSSGVHRHDCDSGRSVSGDGSGSLAGRSGSDGVAGRRYDSRISTVTQEETGLARAQATAEREEQQLMASIARLDALLKDDRVPASKSFPSCRKSKSAASNSTARTEDVAQTEVSQSGPRERKPARSGGVAQTRVRKGSGKETQTCGSARVAPAMPAGRSSATSAIESAAVPPTTATAVTDTFTAITDIVVFPPLAKRERMRSDEAPERGRYRRGLNSNGDINSENAKGDLRGNCRKGDRQREPLRAYDGPVSPLRIQTTDEGRGWGRRGHHAEVRDCYRPRDVVRSSFAPARRAFENAQYGNSARVESDQYGEGARLESDECADGARIDNGEYGNSARVQNDQYGNGARAPRHPKRWDEGWTETVPCAPARYQDAICRDEREELMDEYPYYEDYDPRGRGGRTRSYHRRIAATPQNVRESRVEGRSWEGDPRGDDYCTPGRDRNGRTEYDR